jgi:hypothetical protein
MTFALEKAANFRRKLFVKIAENNAHNIDPCWKKGKGWRFMKAVLQQGMNESDL